MEANSAISAHDERLKGRSRECHRSAILADLLRLMLGENGFDVAWAFRVGYSYVN